MQHFIKATFQKPLQLIMAAIIGLSFVAMFSAPTFAASDGTIQRAIRGPGSVGRVRNSEGSGSSESALIRLPAGVIQMVTLINQERAKAGLSSLSVDPTLARFAGMKTRDMVHYNYFGHQSPRLGNIYDLLERGKFNYQYVAENLIGAASPDKAHTRLMATPSQRSNILNPSFHRIGIAVQPGGPFGVVITEIFTD